MRTISQVVEELVQRSPFLMEAIGEGIANNAQIARKIKPEVEKRLLEEVSEASISMALHRFEKSLQAPAFGTRHLKELNDIRVQSNLVAFVYPNSSDVSNAFLGVSQTARPAVGGARGRKDAFVNFSRGFHESLLIVSREFESEVAQALAPRQGRGAHEKAVKKIDGLSAITMRLPEESLGLPGVYYPILKAIALEGISLVEVFSIRTEFSIIFEDKDIDRAFSVIKRLTS